MGTNYYLRSRPCEHCKLSAPELHIGKSSGGWHFSLHVIPEQEINDLPDWRRLFQNKNAQIFDEYNRKVSTDEMISIITERKCPSDSNWDDKTFEDNHAEKGLGNLVRHKIESGHCIKHGAGTWDCIIGEFS